MEERRGGGRPKMGCCIFLTMEQLWLSSLVTFSSPFPLYKTELLETTISGSESLETCIYALWFNKYFKEFCMSWGTSEQKQTSLCTHWALWTSFNVVKNKSLSCIKLQVYARFYILIISFVFHSNFMSKLVLFLFFRLGIWALRSLSDMFRPLWLARGGERIHSQICLKHGFCGGH